jgi:predicted phage tail protein
MSGGKGGGGASSSTPTEAGDNLASSQYAQVIDLISEGEVEGLAGTFATDLVAGKSYVISRVGTSDFTLAGAPDNTVGTRFTAKGPTPGTGVVNTDRSIFLDNTPLMNDDGKYNFRNVKTYQRNGTQNQDPIPFQDSVASETAVGVAVESGEPIIRTIVNNNIDAVRITLTVPVLQRFDDKGNIHGSSFHYRIQARYEGDAGFTTVVPAPSSGRTDQVISGRTADPYQRDHIVQLSGAFPVDIKVERLGADSASAKEANAFEWTSYTEIINDRLRYPNSALIGLSVDAKQFNRIPQRTYRVRGVKIQLPTGVTVDRTNGRVVYPDGFTWDGTFQAAQWCSDPAWILWDLLLSSRFGIGDHIVASQLDKWAFFAASKYCSALVPDGFGGQEPRFSCNVNIQTSEEAYKLINDMCSVFRAMPYLSTGALTISQDSPQDSAYLFTLANVTPEGFSYSSSSLKTRATVAIVSYLDMNIRDIAKEVVEDKDAIQRYGIITTELSAFACTSRGQARRIGEWLLYTNHYENEVVSFTTAIDAGVIVRPGQVIEISDPVRSEERRGGRITAATTTAITVDDATGLALGTTPTLSVILPNGTVESKAVSSIVGNVITVASAYTSAPNVNSIWIYQTADIQSSTWRVLSVAEQEQMQYTVSAIAYNASKYDYIERDQPLQQRDITNLNIVPDAPIGLQAEEALYTTNGTVASKIVISWQQATNATSYRLRYRYEDDNWVEVDEVSPGYEISNTLVGTYEFEVYAISASNLRSSEPAVFSIEAKGKTAEPLDPEGLSLIAIDQASAIISWQRSTELDVILNGAVLIRHQPVLSGASWENAQEIVPAAAGSQTQKQVPLLEGTYLIKFEDDLGNKSRNAASIVVDLPAPVPRLEIDALSEQPTWAGTFSSMLYSDDQDAITLVNVIFVDDMAQDGDWDLLPSIDSVGGIVPRGEYEFSAANVVDMGHVYDVNLIRALAFTAYLTGGLWDDYIAAIDEWDLIDGDVVDRANAAMYVAATDDDPAGTPDWGEWREFANATVRGRGFKFKVVATTSERLHNIAIDTAGVIVELQQRTESSDVITVPSGTTGAVTYSFTDAFYDPPSVGITAYDMAASDIFAITNVTRSGFDLEFTLSAAADRSFTYTAVGYGKEI